MEDMEERKLNSEKIAAEMASMSNEEMLQAMVLLARQAVVAEERAELAEKTLKELRQLSEKERAVVEAAMSWFRHRGVGKLALMQMCVNLEEFQKSESTSAPCEEHIHVSDPNCDACKGESRFYAAGRTPDGRINNCALANGDTVESCQMCQGKCPDSLRATCPGCGEPQPDDQTDRNKLCDACSEEARGVAKCGDPLDEELERIGEIIKSFGSPAAAIPALTAFLRKIRRSAEHEAYRKAISLCDSIKCDSNFDGRYRSGFQQAQLECIEAVVAQMGKAKREEEKAQKADRKPEV